MQIQPILVIVMITDKRISMVEITVLEVEEEKMVDLEENLIMGALVLILIKL